MKIIIILALLAGCSTKKIINNNSTEVIKTESVDLVHINKYINFTDKEKTEITLAKNEMNRIVGSQCFDDFIKSQNKITKTNNLSRSEIVNTMRTSKVSLAIKMYRSWRSTVGYTYPNIAQLWMNRKFHDIMSICDKASNLLHEVSHKFGFVHASKWHSERKYSVPYTMNEAVVTCCQLRYKK